jgi:UDP-N-acetylmuramoylalanine--D-glutamate ligase
VNIFGQNIVVLGAGESGVGASLLAKNKGFDVFVSDSGNIPDAFKDELIANHILWEEKGHDLDKILTANTIVKSPGIPEKTRVMEAIRAAGIRVVSEIEFAKPFSKGKTVCITGSNGKTTTTLLIHHILKKAGFDVGLAGNIGKSYARQVALEDHEWYVLELSSFQLDDMHNFKANIAVLTNITPDHLDRYEYNMGKYVESKFRITNNLGADEWFIYNADDELILKELATKNLAVKTAPFSIKNKEGMAAYANEKQLTINIKQQLIMSIHELALKGKHNTQNALAAGIAGRLLEVRKDLVRESLGDFVNAEHRMEFVAKVNGIEFINDSKATNINATWFALESMEKPTIWVVGGVDKGNDYSEITDLVKQKVKAIICLGVDNSKIIEAFSGVVDTIVEVNSAIEAVAYGYNLGKKEDVVLLSPACASFDLFENYEDRGNQFKKAVKLL